MNITAIRPFLYVMAVMLLLVAPMSARALDQRCNDNALTSTPAERFIKHNDGLVFDKATRLEWQMCVTGLLGADCELGEVRYFSWWDAEAEVTVFNNSNGGDTDWRLPDIKELYSIIETACEEPSLNKLVFPNHPLLPAISKSWSSTPSSRYISQAWQIEFQNGLLYTLENDTQLTVRLVRTCDVICQQAYD
ncbi:MAG: hypothetical protein COA76_16175 [Moritella sp.]|uniref:Lcl C-terminal domain-containing protein n=1 Tax=Moritella sp. TaxID=78556 RepID=UPI000C0F3520|nr:DUF1566 domain-containing protein [Moritella sp.]MBL1416551.1 DUF1566 domain-containing protein [Moritella sp.]PHR86197.1 MAG: hypothetical protein COA76_16175 [Moritella sp.]